MEFSMSRSAFHPRLLEYFSRYRPIIDSWDEFAAALARPMPSCLWINPERITAEQFEQILRRENIGFTRVGGGAAWQLEEGFAPGAHWTYLAGLTHVQELVSLLPPLALAPQAGEQVLDMCAAPGNKTAQMSLMMRGRGSLIANDSAFGRFPGMRGTLERMGAVNVALVNYDATRLDAGGMLFDAVLADVPCSCEGTTRKNNKVVRRICDRRQAFTGIGVQTDILRRAVALCRPGGRIVYSTCTFAPEENEEVVNTVLRECGDDALTLREIDLPGIAMAPGLTQWNGADLHPDLSRSRRLWPHRNDSGGFYMALLVRGTADLPAAYGPMTNKRGSSAAGYHFNEFHKHEIDPAPFAHYLNGRFGVPPEVTERFRFYSPTTAQVYAAGPDLECPPALRQHTMGLAMLRTGSRREPKLSRDGARLIGKHAREHVIDLNAEERDAFLARRPVVPSEELKAQWRQGYILMRYVGCTLGVGFYRPDSGEIESLYPKAMAR